MKAIAIFASDVHISGRTPAARDEDDWMEAQARVLRRIADLAGEYECPVVWCGDIFDRWNTPVSVVNWAIRNFPGGYAIPGQHDLPFHNYDAVKDSAYWTLVEAGILKNIQPGAPTPLPAPGKSKPVYIYGFPWGKELTPPDEVDGPRIAVVHKYIWITGKSHHAAGSLSPHTDLENMDSSEAKDLRSILSMYDAAFFGDNHIPFTYNRGRVAVVNCGCVIRRSKAEQSIQPAVWVLYDNLSIEPLALDISDDRWREYTTEPKITSSGMDDLLHMLQNADQEMQCISYRDAVKWYVGNTQLPEDIKRILLDSLEG